MEICTITGTVTREPARGAAYTWVPMRAVTVTADDRHFTHYFSVNVLNEAYDRGPRIEVGDTASFAVDFPKPEEDIGKDGKKRWLNKKWWSSKPAMQVVRPEESPISADDIADEEIPF